MSQTILIDARSLSVIKEFNKNVAWLKQNEMNTIRHGEVTKRVGRYKQRICKARKNGLTKMKRKQRPISFDWIRTHDTPVASSRSTGISINALSEVLATVLHERPDLVKMISGSKVAGEELATEKPRRLTMKEHRELAMASFNKKHIREMTKAERLARVSATYRNAYLKEVANQTKVTIQAP